MKAPLLAAAAALMSTALLAQLPPALSNAVVQPGDSPLVAAAKRAAVARQHSRGQAVWVIDDSMVGHRIVTDTSAGLPSMRGGGARNELPSPYTRNDGGRQERAERKQALEREQARMSEEMDQPYGGDVSEDLAEKRMSEIPRELEKTSKPPQ